MIHLCTLSDKNYLILGLALYESLKKHSNDFILHYLAMDEYTFDTLCKIDDDNLLVYSLKDLDIVGHELLKANRPTSPKRESLYHYFSAPLFCYFLLENCMPHVLYVDSDVCFYNDPKAIISCCQNTSIGYITHKHIPPNEYSKVGYFNVGIIYFSNDDIGYACCKWWKDIGLEPNNRWARNYGTCGDQKYLELFFKAFRGQHFKIIDEDIGHSAPWNVTRSSIKDGMITWDSSFVLRKNDGNIMKEVTQKLYFHHFSHFSVDVKQKTYKLDWNGEWGNFLDNPGVPELYQDYFKLCCEVAKKYNIEDLS